MAVSAKDVMTLRRATGAGMMESKAALEESGGDLDTAKDLLRSRGIAKMDTRTDRDSGEGKVMAVLAADHHKGALVQLNTETDFTANNDAFVQATQDAANAALSQPPGPVQKTDEIQASIDAVRLTTKENAQFGQGVVFGGEDRQVGAYVHFTGKVGVLIEVDPGSHGKVDNDLLKDICMHISAAVPVPLAVREEDIDPAVVQKERDFAKQQAIESGKPEHIAEKMVDGKMRKFYDGVVLPRQPFVKDDSQTIGDLLPPGVTITRFARYQVGG